ncbi:hypothetical protein [Actinomadura atramentaria]|uniref:hypothetical protein n=1 Tax=Actinomadura atramentaria TaxID=1990 RepID=UPI000381B025|nr:hypothetical protein [Actinomadura atramentaria]
MANRPPSRLLVSHATADDVDMALIDVSHELRRRVGKAEFNDVLVRVALAHMDEVKAQVRGGQSQ